MTAAPAPLGKRTLLATGVGGYAIFLILFGLTSFLPLVVASFVAGAFVGLGLRRARPSLVTGTLAGLAAAASSAFVYSRGITRALVSAGPSTALGGMPSLYTLLIGLGERGPESTVSRLGVALCLVLGGAVTGLVALAVAALLSRAGERSAGVARVVAVATVAVVCGSFAATAWTTSAETVAVADREPVAGQYSYDSIVYLKTYYLMLKGQGYYDALRDAAAGDTRLIAEGSIRDGKFHDGWMWGPAALRRPTVFYVWRYLAPGGGGGIVALAVAASAIALALVAWGVAPYLAHRSVFVAVFTMPYLLFMTLARNVFFPDYWGALLALGALVLVMRKRWFLAAGALLASTLVRETAGPSLAVVAATLLVVFLRYGRGREWLVRAGAFAVAAGAWLGFERLHESLGARLMASGYRSSFEVLVQTAGSRGLADKVIRPTTYLVPGGFFPLRGVVLLLLAPLGFRAVLASEKEARLVVVTYLLFWVAFLLVVGATSEYWGQTVMLPSFLGIGCLLASADRLDRRLVLAEPIGWE